MYYSKCAYEVTRVAIEVLLLYLFLAEIAVTHGLTVTINIDRLRNYSNYPNRRNTVTRYYPTLHVVILQLNTRYAVFIGFKLKDTY